MTVELLQEPRPTPADKLPDGTDRRQSRRFPHTTLATLRPTEPGEGAAAKTLQAIVLNVSLHGVGLRSPTPLPPGGSYLIDIGNGRLKLHARICIANCRPRPDGTHDIGAAFC
jgi:hypothetical protein